MDDVLPPVPLRRPTTDPARPRLPPALPLDPLARLDPLAPLAPLDPLDPLVVLDLGAPLGPVAAVAPLEPVGGRTQRWLGLAAAVGCHHVFETVGRSVGTFPESRDVAIGVGILLGLAGLLPPQTRGYAVGFTLALASFHVLQYPFVALLWAISEAASA